MVRIDGARRKHQMPPPGEYSMHGRFTRRTPAPLTAALALVAMIAGVFPSRVFARSDGALGETERAAVARVSADAIRRATADLSGPAMEGRGTAQPGGDRAARYVAERFAALGLEPLGDSGTFLQSVAFHAATIKAESRVTSGDVSLAPGTDFVVAPPLPARSVDVTASLAFFGFGVV